MEECLFSMSFSIDILTYVHEYVRRLCPSKLTYFMSLECPLIYICHCFLIISPNLDCGILN